MKTLAKGLWAAAAGGDRRHPAGRQISYQMFKDKEDGCVRAVFRPHA